MSDQQSEGRFRHGVKRASPRVQVHLLAIVQFAQAVMESADRQRSVGGLEPAV
jgi:hypothetical protein